MDASMLLALTMLATDYSQTSYIAKHPTVYHEYNPILGQHPSQGKVAVYFAGCAGSVLVLNKTLPKEYAHAVNFATVGFEAAIIGHNAHIGIKFSF